MKNKSFIIKGDIIYSDTPEKLLAVKDGYLICKDGISGGVYESLEEIPEIYRDCDLIDYSGKLVIPGLTDLHIHAPQYAYRGIWTDMELIDWLNFHTFPEESKYKDEDYAKRAYEIFVNDIKKTSTARFCAFSTIHVEATEILMDMVEESVLRRAVLEKPAGREVVLTGRDPAPWMTQAADYITDMRAVKHPFDAGVPAREGVEF